MAADLQTHTRLVARLLRIENVVRRLLDGFSSKHFRVIQTASGARSAILRHLDAHLYEAPADYERSRQLAIALGRRERSEPISDENLHTLRRLEGVEHFARELLTTYERNTQWRRDLEEALAPPSEPSVDEAARLAAEEEAMLAGLRKKFEDQAAFRRTPAGRREEARKKAAQTQLFKLNAAIRGEKERMRQRIRKEGGEFPPGMLAMFYWGFSGSNMVDLNLRHGGLVKIADYLREKKKEFTRELMADKPEMLAILVSDDHINREFKFSPEEIAAGNLYGERAVCYGRDRLLDLVKTHLRTFYRENPVTTGDTT